MSKRKSKAAPDYLFKLAELCPSIAFSVSRQEDPYFQWDGDGPDPRRRGYIPCLVTVSAKAVCLGELIEGLDTLGGSYFKPSEPMGEVHGYLPQMLLEAVDALAVSDKVPGKMTDPVFSQAMQARLFLRQLLEDKYKEQQARSV